MLEHGGRLRMAAKHYGIALEAWIDLSTGINPKGWPIPALPRQVWQRLPEAEDGLAAAAGEYYGSPLILPAAGSQPVIQLLPRLRPGCRVGLMSTSYAEHAHAWRGHQLVELEFDAIDAKLDDLDVLVLCNPNNPTGHRFTPSTLLDWREKLARRGGWLVVDEAFVDASPELSIAPHAGLPGLVVLRSMGKFFGLAGARVGFVLGWQSLLSKIAEELGPWSVNGPARWVAALALQDAAWQGRTREQLMIDSTRLGELLAMHGLTPSGATALFQWVIHPQAKQLHESLARQAILTRHFDSPCSIRFGLPGSMQQWQDLEAALQKL